MLITNFASGELSQNLNGRVDIQQYYQGAARIENFEIIPTGGIKRRVGTKRLVQLNDNNRIIPFIVDKNTIYVLELACVNNSGVIYIWSRTVGGGLLKVATVSNAPWTSLAQAKEVHYAQNYNTIVFVHKEFNPYILELDGNTFTGSAIEFDFIPHVELDDDYDYIMNVAGTDFPQKGTSESGLVTFTYITIIAGIRKSYTKPFSNDITDYYCIKAGKLYKWNVSEWLSVGSDIDSESGLFTTVNKRPSCVAFFNNRLFFASTGGKPQKVWASTAPDEEGTRYNDFCTYKKYVTVNKVVKDADLHIFTCDISQVDINVENQQTVLRNVSQNFTSAVLKEDISKYYVSSSLIPVGTKILAVTSDTITIDTASINVAFSEEHPTETNCTMSIQLWKTADSASAEDYEYMVVSNNITTADCSLFFELASDQNDAIKFLSSNRFLAVGTESSIWSIDAGISALNINAMMQGRYGSDDIQAQAVETATVYFAQGKKGIREFYYDGQSEAFRTNNIALLADHILRESAVVDFDYMTNPYSRLVIVRADGTAACMLYDKTNGIMAWNRLILGSGLIKSCAITRGYDENDLVYFVVKDGNNYYMEVLDYGEEVYLDSWQVYSAGITGYNSSAILFNQTKNITCPANDIPSGFIESGNVVYIGYAIRSYIKSMPIVSNGKERKRITALLVRFLNSYKPVMKCTGLSDEKFTTIKTVPYSGIGKVTYPGITDYDVFFELEASEPYPVNILAVDAQTA